MTKLRPWPAQHPIGSRPFTKRFPLTASQTFKAGDIVFLTGSPLKVSEVSGADPTPLLGIAAEDAANVIESGYVMVYVFDNSTIFAIMGSTDPTTAHIGNQYGVLEDGDGVYTIDISETGQKRFDVVGIDVNRKLFFVKVMVAHRQLG